MRMDTPGETPRGLHPLRKRLWGFVVTLLVLSVAFYWYQLRPENIRSICAIDTSKRAFGPSAIASSTNGLELVRLQNELFETYYLLCVRSHGLPH